MCKLDEALITKLFQHTAARRRLGRWKLKNATNAGFNTQPPEGGWDNHLQQSRRMAGFNTQPPEGGWLVIDLAPFFYHCFNTQPPEGGWIKRTPQADSIFGFNTQPPEGGWDYIRANGHITSLVSTHSRPKAAGY